MKDKIDLSIDINTVLQSVSLKKTVIKLSLVLGIGCTLTPLIFKQLDRESKTLLLMSGVIGNLTASLLPRDTKDEKLKTFWEKIVADNYANQLKHEALRVNAETEIIQKNMLADYIDNDVKVPAFQKEFWANKFGVVPLITSFFVRSDYEPIEQETETQPTLPTAKTIFENVIEKYEVDDQVTLTWLKKAIKESCFVAGKKGSGKSHLLRWLLAGFIAQSNEKDLFYVIDKHYDEDSPWLFGIDENQLIKLGRLVDGKGAIVKILELHQTLLNRIEKGQTYKKLGSHVRVIIDEIDSYSEDESEILAAFVKDVEYQGRKFGFSVHLGAHSIKKGEMGIDSSVLGSMLNILYPSVVLDRNSVLSGAFPTVQVMKRNIDRYKSQSPQDARVVVIGDDSEVYCSHVPPLDLMHFTINTESDDDQQPLTNPLTDAQKTYLVLKNWVDSQGVKPSSEKIAQYWFGLTGEVLSEAGIKYLLEKLGLDKNVQN